MVAGEVPERFIGGKMGERGRGLRYFVFRLRGTIELGYGGAGTDKIRYNLPFE